ncbi:hypothetical protein CDAR_82991 [Caerostris darwini]|uniref:LAGLIDADG homing endonuclease n=1 Tax=Caerostris darwini TaxID=1538125 RepID=A0AAV4NV50_9ARAC|nr:hypothetical protein CDAR_82991 [Caerostris darwini]
MYEKWGGWIGGHCFFKKQTQMFLQRVAGEEMGKDCLSLESQPNYFEFKRWGKNKFNHAKPKRVFSVISGLLNISPVFFLERVKRLQRFLNKQQENFNSPVVTLRKKGGGKIFPFSSLL